MYKPRLLGFCPWKQKNLHTAFGQYAKRNKSTEIPQEEHGSHNIVGVDIVELCKEGRLKEALQFLCINQPAIGVLPSVYASLLKGCIDEKALPEGKRVHAHMIKNRFQPRNFLQNRLLDMYAMCGSLDDARQVFDKMSNPDVFSWTGMIVGYMRCGIMEVARLLFDSMPERDVVSWNAIIAGYIEYGGNNKALILCGQMMRTGMDPDHFTFTSILSACANLEALATGKKIHNLVIKVGLEANLSVGNALVTMYGKCGSIDNAFRVFDRMYLRNVLSRVAMITAYVQCGNIHDARQVFDRIPERNTVSWNAMIAGYAQHGHGEEALKLFLEMQQAGMRPDYITFVSLISACACFALLEQGRQVHGHMIVAGFETCVPVGNAIITLYASCGDVEDAQCVFWKMPVQNAVTWNTMVTLCTKHGSMEDAYNLFVKMPERNIISWTAMIAGYAQHGQSELALKLFAEMQIECVKADHFTFGSVLSACANMAALEHGRQIHGHIIQTGIESYIYASNALVTMYAKCGSIGDAEHVFKSMLERDAVSWNAIIAGCAQNGYVNEALYFFEQMQRIGVSPDHITFIGILSACSHTGLLEEGWHYFNSMSEVHGIRAEADHYACMVDLLGRAGQLDEAERFISNMPFEPDASVWEALLHACRIHGNMHLGEQAAECLFELEPQTEATYILISNIYAAHGRWDDVAKVRKAMKDRGVEKKPGCSWIEIKNKVHAFIVGY